ncbi:hypothetical protein V8E53_009906 [Lactarius tabidus]
MLQLPTILPLRWQHQSHTQVLFLNQKLSLQPGCYTLYNCTTPPASASSTATCNIDPFAFMLATPLHMEAGDSTILFMAHVPLPVTLPPHQYEIDRITVLDSLLPDSDIQEISTPEDYLMFLERGVTTTYAQCSQTVPVLAHHLSCTPSVNQVDTCPVLLTLEGQLHKAEDVIDKALENLDTLSVEVFLHPYVTIYFCDRICLLLMGQCVLYRGESVSDRDNNKDDEAKAARWKWRWGGNSVGIGNGKCAMAYGLWQWQMAWAAVR